jgi:exosome complex component CSL4
MTELLMPGDELATSEEYISGDGTYEDEGIIYAAIIGQKDFDESEKIAKVKGVNPPGILKAGDIIFGEVTNVSNSVANVIISGLENGKTAGQNLSGVVHVSKIKGEYIKDARHEFHIGDLVRARIEQVKPSIQLATNAEEFGVLKARCFRCRSILSNKDGSLFCGTCERTETRKLAGDFHRYSPYHTE